MDDLFPVFVVILILNIISVLLLIFCFLYTYNSSKNSETESDKFKTFTKSSESDCQNPLIRSIFINYSNLRLELKVLHDEFDEFKKSTEKNFYDLDCDNDKLYNYTESRFENIENKLSEVKKNAKK